MKESTLENSGETTVKLLLLKKVAGSSHYETSMGNKNAKGIGHALFEMLADYDEIDFGEELVKFFGLKTMRGSKDLYKTSVGTKTKKGLNVTIKRAFESETFCASIIG